MEINNNYIEVYYNSSITSYIITLNPSFTHPTYGINESHHFEGVVVCTSLNEDIVFTHNGNHKGITKMKNT